MNAAESEPNIRTLVAEKATPQALEPFGFVLGYNPDVEPMPIDFYDGTVKVRRLGEFVSDDQTELPVVTIQPRPLELRYVERHFKHTQAFVPLGGTPFLAVMAPPTDSELPELDDLRAFIFDGQAGFVMKQGTWHEFPYALQNDTNLIVILRREATDGLVRDNVVQNEAHGPDLDKKDLLERTNTIVRIQT
ncbi:MAG: ureidoglycolate lyase [Pseudomonadota bacterium]